MHLSTAPLRNHDAPADFLQPRTLRCGDLVLDLNARRALVADADIALSPLEFAVLNVLVSRRGLPMSKEAIGAELPVQVDPRMIDVYVTRARAKLATAGLGDTIISVWGRGYMASPAIDPEPEPALIEPPDHRDLGADIVPA